VEVSIPILGAVTISTLLSHSSGLNQRLAASLLIFETFTDPQ
jgi:CubicO group peptidase (beta-lactamase class C family)